MRFFARAGALLASSVRGDEAVSGSAAGADLEEGHGSLHSVQRKNHAVDAQSASLQERGLLARNARLRKRYDDF